MDHYIGLDLGGTFIKAGAVDQTGQVLASVSVDTGGQGGPEAVMANLASAAAAAAEKAGLTMDQVAGIGVGSPGPVDFDRGVIKAAPNLPGWVDVPLRDRIAELTGRPTAVENDANAAAMGEFWAGAGRDREVRNLIMLTLGTGIGSGIIIEGKVLHGGHGYGGEGGHMIVVPEGRLCGCGQRGCLEAYASASRTGERAAEAIEAGETSSLQKAYDAGGGHVSAKQVFDGAKAGDHLAERIVDETAAYLGIACVSLCRLFDPQMIVFAGGMILAGDFLFDRIRTAFDEHTWKLTDAPVRIVPAQLGNDAGFIGAAAVAWGARQAAQAG